MRTMLPALEAAARNLSHIPAVRVCLYNKRANSLRPQFSLLYSGGEEDNFHASCFAADGSLIRARIQSGAPNYALFRSRVASPGPASDYSQWVFTGSVSSSSKVTLAGSGADILLFALDADNLTIKAKESTDNGVTWGDWVNIVTAPSTPEYLAASFDSSGSVCALFYNIAGTVYTVRRSTGAWGTPEAWSNGLNDVTGIAAMYDAGWRLAVSGEDSSGKKLLATCTYTAAFSWTGLQTVMAADSGTSISFDSPSLSKPSAFALFFVEHYSGVEAYGQVRWAAMAASGLFGDNLWTEAMGFDRSGAKGCDSVSDGAYWWLASANKVLRASLGAGLVDVSNDVVKIEVDTAAEGSLARITLRNDAGQYNNPALGIGSQLEIQWGYVTSQGALYTDPLAYWVERLEHTAGGPASSLVLHGGDGWSLLRSLRARYQYVWTAGSASVRDILRWLLSRAGIAMEVVTSSGAFSGQAPAFTVYANEDYASVVKRLLEKVPDVIYFRESTARVAYPQPDDVSDYSFGTDYPILEGRFLTGSGEFNSFIVLGSGVTTLDWDWNSVPLNWERLVQIADKNLTTAAAAHERGLAVRRRVAIDSQGGAIVVPLHPGQELFDVIDVTEGRCGLDAAKRRVGGLKHRYDTRNGEYSLEMNLSAV